MIHDIDIILSLINSNVLKIDASGVSVVSDTIDIANARIEFENGAVANVTASRISQKKMRKMRLFQKDAYVSLDFNSGVSEVFRLIDSEETVDSAHINFGEMGIGSKKKRIIYEQPEVIEMNALKYELDLFIKCVLNNEEPAVSGADGLKALRVADEIIEKIEQSLKKVNL
jgi:predicted dehydrogenase